MIQGYLQPLVSRYAKSLLEKLTEWGFDKQTLIMQSNGGVVPVSQLADRAAYIVRSGPAAGVKAAAAVATEADLKHVITLDMGGTTAKASTVVDGEVALTAEYEVGAGINVSSLLVKGGGHALRIPGVTPAAVAVLSAYIDRVPVTFRS